MANPGVLSLNHVISRGSKWVHLAWTADSNTDAAQLQRRVAGETLWSSVPGATSSPFRDTNCQPDTRYDYRVAYADTSTIYSNILQVKTLPARVSSNAPEIPSLVEIWDARMIQGVIDGGAVTTFPGANGLNLTGTGTYAAANVNANGKPCVVLNGTSDLFKRTGFNLPQPFTVVVVGFTNSSKNSNGIVGGGGSGDWAMLNTTSGLTVDQQALNGAGNDWPYSGSNPGNGGSMVIGPVPLTSWTGIGIADNGDTACRAYVNGYGALNYGDGSFTTAGITDFQIGKSRNTAGTFFDGGISHVRLYNRVLTDDELLRLHTWLQDEFDLTGENRLTSAPTKQYLFFTTAPDNSCEHLSVMESNDAINFGQVRRVTSDIEPCRDPSPLRRNGAIYVTHGIGSLHSMPNSGYADKVPVLKSIDGGVTFTLLGYWDLSSIYSVPGGTNNTWAPDFLEDDDGTLWIYCTTNNGQAGFHFYMAQVLDLDKCLFGAPQQMTGSLSSIDLCVRKLNGLYCAVYGSGGVKLATATSRLGPYTDRSTILDGSGANTAEGPFLFIVGSEIRAYYSRLASPFVYSYKASTDAGTTWGSEVHTTQVGYANAHGGMIAGVNDPVAAASRVLGSGGTMTFDPVTIASTWTLVGVIPVGNRKGRVGIDILVDVAAITSLKVTRSFEAGGHVAGQAVDLAVDADLDTRTTEVSSVLPASAAYTAGADARIQLLMNCDGVAEYGVHAKSSGGAVLTMTGRLPREYT